MQCDGNVLQSCSGGSITDMMTCPDVCDATLGCVLCSPGTATCNGNVASVCNDSGTGFTDVSCDPVQGMSCDANAGGCTGACSPNSLHQSYIGCEYYATVTGNPVNNSFNFAITIANTSNAVATVTIEDGALTAPQTVMVPANTVSVQRLPWVADLKLCQSSDPFASDCTQGGLPGGAQVAKGAYHVRSNAPVTVYQFNSYDYQIQGGALDSYTNDASLLLPTNVWRTQYYAAAWQTLVGINPSELAVTAWQDGTTVTLNTRADTVAGGNAPGFATNVPQSVMLNAGDVLEITSNTGDLTGSSVNSDKPVQLISGHYCADVPDGVAACDHMEESMFGVDTLGTHYLINAPAVTTEPGGKVEVVRVIATASNITLTYDPPQPGAPTTIANAGDFIEIPNSNQTFAIQASDKVLVAQYMEGQDADGAGTGDPAMALAVPVEQFRTDYLFDAPTSYESNYVDVLAPMGAQVMLDGVPLAFTPIGSTGYGLSRVTPLSNGPSGDGSHAITGDMAFGISVYGYGQYTSYWYPGGLNLTTVID
jgi:hypothetical protein